jgi:YD repeat-containing protein
MDRAYNRFLSLPDADGDDIGQAYQQIGFSQPIKLIYHQQAGTQGATLTPLGYQAMDPTFGVFNIKPDADFYVSDNTEGQFQLATSDNTAQDAPLITDATGWLLTLKDGRTFTFDAAGRLQKMTDPAGNSLTFNRDGANRVTSIVHSPSGQQIVFHRDGNGKVTSITDPRGNSAQYTYTSNGNLQAYFARGTDPSADAATTSFTYVGNTHMVDNILDAKGQQAAKNYYDDAGRLIKTVDADGNATTFTHDIAGRTETIQDRAGNVTVHKYDERGNIVETDAPDGTVTQTSYHRWSDGTLSDLKEV